MLEGKYICTVGNLSYMTKGKIYIFVNGRTTWDSGETTHPSESLKEFNKEYTTKIKPVE